jgi:hypothetical protein
MIIFLMSSIEIISASIGKFMTQGVYLNTIDLLFGLYGGNSNE